MMEQITLEQFRRTVRIRLRLLRVFIPSVRHSGVLRALLGPPGRCAGRSVSLLCRPAHRRAFRAGHLRRFYLHPPTKMLRDDVLLHKMYTKATDEREALFMAERPDGRRSGSLCPARLAALAAATGAPRYA